MKAPAGSVPPSNESRRHDLVQAAFRGIAERGFEGLRTRDVAADAGVNIATLHYYFPTKEALIRGEPSLRRLAIVLCFLIPKRSLTFAASSGSAAANSAQLGINQNRTSAAAAEKGSGRSESSGPFGRWRSSR